MDLFKALNVSNISYEEVDEYYKYFKNKNEETDLAYKILKDKYYNAVYSKYKDLELVYKAGFINSELNDIDYKINLLTTPFDKILNNLDKSDKQPVVLISTGGFNPIHQGHIDMMKLAKNELEKNNYNVVGGYFSISHNDYVSSKLNVYNTKYERIENANIRIEKSNWLMVDPFESIFVPTYINFTDVLQRIKVYLQKYVNENIKIAYVFGGDNVEFMYCFEDNDIGICINRTPYEEKFNKIKNEIKKDNCYFIDNKNKSKTYSSTKLRQIKPFVENNNDGIYYIRNEKDIPFSYLQKYNKIENILEVQNSCIEKFKNILSEYIPLNTKIELMNLKEQIKIANMILKNKETISLDNYFNGTYNINTSRLFEISSRQSNYIKLTNRYDNDFIKEINKIKPGHYILVDDDKVSGNTIRSIKEYINKDVFIDNEYFLSKTNNPYDVVDFRDFILGANDSGLKVRLDLKNNIKVPYIYPYVNLNTRASIPVDKQIEFTIKILNLNLEFYNKLAPKIKLKDVDENFIKLMNAIGFCDDEYMIDIIKFHINNLKC